MNVLVTGGTGFLGRHVVDGLLSAQMAVSCSVRNPGKCYHLVQSGCRIIPGDLAEPEVARRSVRGADVIVHVAGQLGGWGGRELFIRNNVETTRNLLEAAVEFGVRRFIYISSAVAYGLQPNRVLTEDSPVIFEPDPYCESKLRCEALLRTYADNFHITTTIIRPSIIFGPHDEHFILLVARSLMRRTMLMIGPRGQGPPLIYVRDIVRFIRANLSWQTSGFEIYNLSMMENISWEKINDTLASGLGFSGKVPRVPFRVAYSIAAVLEFLWKTCRSETPPLLTRFVVSLIGLQYHIDSTKALSMPGFSSFTPFSDAIGETICWLHGQQTRDQTRRFL